MFLRRNVVIILGFISGETKCKNESYENSHYGPGPGASGETSPTLGTTVIADTPTNGTTQDSCSNSFANKFKIQLCHFSSILNL